MGIGNSEAVGGKVAGVPGFATRLVPWLQRIFRDGYRGLSKSGCERRLTLVETLQLGGKRQLMLILCDNQLLLVGAGADSIQSIVELRHQSRISSDPVRSGGGVPRQAPADAIRCAVQEAVCQ